MTTTRSVFAALLAVCLFAPAAWAGGVDFTGTYVTSGPAGTLTVELRQAGAQVTGTMRDAQGSTMQLQARLDEDGGLEGSVSLQGRSIPIYAELDGDTLVLELELGDQTKEFQLKRQTPGNPTPGGPPLGGTPPPPQAPGNPLAPRAPGNPLAPGPVSSPWAGTFENGDKSVVLTLRQTGAAGDAESFAGELTVGGQRYPVEAKEAGAGQLAGTFKVDGQPFPFEAKLTGDALTLTSGGATHALQRQAAARNPLAGGTPGLGAPGPTGATVPLNGVYAGPVAPLQHPKGWFQCEVPQGWGVAGHDEGSGFMLLNPGYQPGQPLEARILLLYAELTETEAARSALDLAREGLPDIHRFLAQEFGIQATSEPQVQPTKAGPHDAVHAEWTGTERGSTQLTLWAGSVVQDRFAVTILAMVLKGQEARYLGGAKRALVSLRLRPPAPGSMVAAQGAGLDGREFGYSDSTPAGVFSVWIKFASGNRVAKTRQMSGSDVTGTDEGNWGRYQVQGNTIQMQFPDGTSEQGTLERDASGKVTAIVCGSKRYR